MELSNETDKIFPAMVKMQASLSNAYKGSHGHGYNYADLAQCINTAKPHLEANGLAVSQLLGNYEGEQTLITMLAHESGQYIKSEFVMAKAQLQGGAGKNPAQVMGSSITYMRRYAFAAILGMAQTDDDAAICQNEPEIDYEGICNHYAQAMQAANDLNQLKSAYQQGAARLKGSPFLQTLTQIKDEQKARLTNGN